MFSLQSQLRALEATLTLIFGFISWIFCGIGAGYVASQRGADGCLWFGLGVLFGPFGLAAAFVAGQNVKCLCCQKRIHPEAEKCPHCRTQIKNKPAPNSIVLGSSCPRCGFRNDDGWTFCVKCDERLTGQEEASPVPVTSGLARQIEHLAEINAKGLLTDEEFRQAKAKLLK